MVSEIYKLVEIEREAEERIKNAHLEAMRKVEEAKQRAEEIIKQAKNLSFDDLIVEYEDKIKKRREDILSRYKKMADEIRLKGQKNFEKAVDYVLKLVMGV